MIPKISVIIPVYNVSEYLDQCLWSVTNQTFQDIEIIVINDGSTDNSLSIIEKYAITDSRIIVINKQNKGVVSARKTGVDIAKSEYLHYLDGDDYLELNCYELLYAKAVEENADIAIMKFWFDDIDKNKQTESFEYPLKEMNNTDFLLHLFSVTCYYCVWQYIHKKSLYNNNIMLDTTLIIGEDAYMTTQLAYYSKKIVVLDSVPLYHYIIRDSSITNSIKEKARLSNSLQYINSIINFIKEKPEYSVLGKATCSLIVKTEAVLLRNRCFTNGHSRGKVLVKIFKKYPDLEKSNDIYPLRKLIKLYSVNPMLGWLFAQYYRMKKKIK